MVACFVLNDNRKMHTPSRIFMVAGKLGAMWTLTWFPVFFPGNWDFRYWSIPIAPNRINKYQEGGPQTVLDLFSRDVVEHTPDPLCYTVMLPRTLLLVLGVPFFLSWLLVLVFSIILLVFLWPLVRCPWTQYVITCLYSNLVNISNSFLCTCGFCL